MVSNIFSLVKNKSSRVQVLVYLKGDGICIGFVNCPGHCLLEHLNNIPPLNLTDNGGHLQLLNARFDCLNRRETAESANINIHDILFIKPISNGDIPSWPVRSRRVRLYLPSYVVTGQVHHRRDRHWSNELNPIYNFFPVTNAEITLRTAGIKHRSIYVAVNKDHVLSAEAIGALAN